MTCENLGRFDLTPKTEPRAVAVTQGRLTRTWPVKSNLRSILNVLTALRRLVFEREAAAIFACAERVKKEKIEFDFVLFENDVSAALGEIRDKWLIDRPD